MRIIYCSLLGSQLPAAGSIVRTHLTKYGEDMTTREQLFWYLTRSYPCAGLKIKSRWGNKKGECVTGDQIEKGYTGWRLTEDERKAQLRLQTRHIFM